MRNEYVAIAIACTTILLLVLIIAAVWRSSTTKSSIRERIRNLVLAAGWTNLTNPFFLIGVKGIWRSFPVEFAYRTREKSTPRRFILTIGAQTDARLIVKRRFAGFFSNKPMTWFGPPLIDAGQDELWVRGDQPTLAQRIFADPQMAALIAENVVGRFDEIRVDKRGLRIRRALDERPVRARYGLPLFFDPEKAEPIAREELALAEALVGRLSMLA
jgi:hypothetical protein